MDSTVSDPLDPFVLLTLKRPVPYREALCAVSTVLRIFDHIDLLHDYDFRRFISGFFRNANPDEIKIENLHSFLSWVMYSAFYKDLSLEDREKIDFIIGEAGRRYGYFPEAGFNPALKHVNMTLESVPYIHRPLIMYVGNGLLELLFQQTYLRARGFRFFSTSGITYWYKDGGSRSTKPPLLVLHGITNGWITYGYLIHSLLATTDGRSVILVDVDAIKIKSLCFEMLNPDEFPKAVLSILKRHRIAKVSIIGHSFGSITGGWIVTSHPEVVSHVAIIDPVSLLLGLPEVAYNFLYRPPSNLIEGFIIYGASREITISHMLHRHFWWHRNILYLEDIPSHIGVVVALSEVDPILNASALLQYTVYCNDLRAANSGCISRSASRSDLASVDEANASSMDSSNIGNSTGITLRSGRKAGSRPVSRSSSSNTLSSSVLPSRLSSNNLSSSALPSRMSSNSLASDVSTASTSRSPANILPVFWAGYTHGQFLMCPTAMPSLLQVIKSNEGKFEYDDDLMK